MNEQHNDVNFNNKKLFNKALALGISALLLLLFLVLEINKIQLINKTIIIIIFVVSFVLSFAYFFKKYFEDRGSILKWYNQITDFLFLLNMALIAIQIFFMLLFYPAVINHDNGSSMRPTLAPDDKLIVQSLGKVERGKIVILKLDKYSDFLIKRVIAIPGDNFYYDSGGYLYLNDELYIEEYLLDENGMFTYDTLTEEFSLKDKAHISGIEICNHAGECRVPEDYYFVMGDNRKNSLDSRVFGLVHKSEIMGVVKYRRHTLFDWEKIE